MFKKDDKAIVQAARISYGAGTKTVLKDDKLIRLLMRNRHTSPFEQCEIKFHVRVPMDCWRQWIRHRTANVNEYSTRYSEAIDSMQHTPPELWRKQASKNKQGSEGTIETWPKGYEVREENGKFTVYYEDEARYSYLHRPTPGEYLTSREEVIQLRSRETYKERLAFGVAREQARKDLPLSTYTEAYWKIDLHNLLHFLRLRMDSHAQAEISLYANEIGRIVSMWVPGVWDAFVKCNSALFRSNSTRCRVSLSSCAARSPWQRS